MRSRIQQMMTEAMIEALKSNDSTKREDEDGEPIFYLPGPETPKGATPEQLAAWHCQGHPQPAPTHTEVLFEEDEESEEEFKSSATPRARPLLAVTTICMLVAVACIAPLSFVAIQGTQIQLDEVPERMPEVESLVVAAEIPHITASAELMLPQQMITSPTCTNFKIRDLTKGPDADGCIEVQCEEGYTQLKRWAETTWAHCP